jgi:hypothetical protein
MALFISEQVASVAAYNSGNPQFLVYAGENTLQAAASAADAAQSAAYAGGFETPEYASQSAGNAATTAGDIFRVPLGTTPQTFSWYRRLSSGSELVDPLVTRTVFDTVPTAPFISIPKDATSDQSAAINAAISSQGMVEFPAYPSSGRYGITSGISIARSNVHLRFQNGAALIPYGTAPNQLIDIRGSAPTSWTALSRDAYAHSNLIRTATDPGWQIGDWIEVRSSKIIDTTPNYTSDMQGECHRVALRYNNGSSFDFIFDTVLSANYLVADSATAGKATMLENIVIERPQFNDEEFGSNIMNFGIRAEYCAGLKIISPRGYGSKTPLGNDRANGDLIKLINCIDPYIEDARQTHGGYYGLSILGWTRHLRSYGGIMTDVRHAVSLVQRTLSVVGTPGRVQEYGQPFDILINGMTAQNTSLSGFDTHDTGLEIHFDSCTSIGAGDDGFQFRVPKVKATDCVAYGAHVDGFSSDDMTGTGVGAADCELINCRAIGNGRSGVNFRYNRGTIVRGEYMNNGTIASRPDVNLGSTISNPPILPPDLANQNTVQAGACGIRINGGLIDGARIEGNAGTGGVDGSAIIYGDTLATVTMRPLTVRGVIAPANATQTRFMTLGGSALDFGLVTLAGGNQIDGYGNKLFDSLGTADNIPPASLGGSYTTTVASQRRGQATLAGGQVFVANTAVRNRAADAAGEAIVSKINLTRMVSAGVPGSLFVKSITDQVGFTVTSTSYAEPTRTNVVRNNTNVGVTNGVIGSGGVLPTNWSIINTPSGLTTEIIGTGTEAVLGGGTQNYIDIKVSGTAGAAGTMAINFDTITNPAAAAAVGQTWTASFGAKLQAGTLTGFTPRAALISYTSGGSAITTFNTAITVGANHNRFSQTATLTGAAAFTRAVMQIVVANGAVTNGTFRIYMPQLEQASDASAPIATSGSAATRTQDASASDNSTFEWVVSI